jgi:hypothetical protein
VLIDLVVDALSAIAGFMGMLWLLLLWVGDGVRVPITPEVGDPITGAEDHVAIQASNDPFIPMPDHLRTRQEMVAWITNELPKLMAEMTVGPKENPRS